MRRLAVLFALVLVSAAGAGSYFPPPGDYGPAWSPDGTYVSFLTTRGGRALADVRPDGSAEQRLLEGEYGVLSPDWKKIAWVDDSGAANGLYVKTLADGQVRKLATSVSDFEWSPDSSRLAVVSGQDLVLVGLDGSTAPPVARAAADPVWSPSGDRLAYVSHAGEDLDVHVVRPDGSGDADLTAGDRRVNARPLWAPGGKSLAFVTSDGKRVQIEVSDLSGGRRVVPAKISSTNGALAWLPGGRELAVGSGEGTVAVDVTTGRTRPLLPFGGGLVWSPDGSWIAFEAGGECRDRWGVYVAKADGTGIRRVTNDCRIVGTAGPDRLVGTDLADVLVGLGGNDRLEAVDTGYVGDTLLGGAGNDLLLGGYQRDELAGGDGDDTLRGGPSADKLTGGSGRDLIDGQGGRDTIYAVDGRRDRILCGTNAPGTPEQDVVYADRVDSVAADCEVVHRT